MLGSLWGRGAKTGNGETRWSALLRRAPDRWLRRRPPRRPREAQPPASTTTQPPPPPSTTPPTTAALSAGEMTPSVFATGFLSASKSNRSFRHFRRAVARRGGGFRVPRECRGAHGRAPRQDPREPVGGRAVPRRRAGGRRRPSVPHSHQPARPRADNFRQAPLCCAVRVRSARSSR